MKFIKTLLALIVAVSTSLTLIGQDYTPALAFPVNGITIDGDLSDWPKSLRTFPVPNLAFGEVTGPDDLSADFKVGYNPEKDHLYIGLTVNDSEYISSSPNGDIDDIDNVLLYLDEIHDAAGGGRQLLIAGGDLRETGGAIPSAWDPYTLPSSWEGVQLKIRSEGGVTVYEWQIPLKHGLKPGMVIGFDLIIADSDPEEEGPSWLTWKRGTGKSEGSQRLGEIVLASSWETVGEISGKVATSSDHIPRVEFVKVQSRTNPGYWMRLPVDTLGSYHGYLPEGSYEVVSERTITSPVNTDGFFLEPLRITAKAPVYAEVPPGKLSIPATLELQVIPAPRGLFEEKGMLLQPTLAEHKIDKFVQGFQQYFGIPGISLALVKDGKVVYDKVFGVTNNLTQEPLDKNSLFEAASISKSVFSLMVLKLVEEGRLDLDKPLYEYLRFPNVEHDERYKLITARHVLNHQTGMTNWPVGSYTGFISDNKADLVFAPGTGFEYSGEAMNYLGRVVEKIIGMSLSKFFLESPAPALGLTTTRFAYTEDLADKIALGHWHDYPRFKNKFSGIDSPASSVLSNAHDFSNFLTGLLEKKYLSETSYRLISTPYQEIKEEKKLFDKKLPQALAHGFFITDRKAGRTLAHGGNNGDFDCKFVLLPQEKAGFVVFTNSNLGDEFIRLLELYLLDGKEGYLTEFSHHE